MPIHQSRFHGVGLALLVLTGASRADGVQWRSDYNVALQEAKDKQRPLFLDFGTANCFWCTRLDADTLRDSAVVRTLNEQFIPVKVDADRNTALAQALAIESYPTLVFANPRGQLLGKHVGYVDAAKLRQQLQRALTESATPAGERGAPGILTRTTAPPILSSEPPDPVKAASARLAQELSELYLKLAAEAVQHNQHAEAQGYLERVVLLGTAGQIQIAQDRMVQVRSALAVGVGGPKARAQSPR